jgi:hypothetical protein
MNEVHKQLVSPIQFYTEWLNDNSLIKSDYPMPSIEDLNLQIIFAPQIQGETEYISLDPSI